MTHPPRLPILLLAALLVMPLAVETRTAGAGKKFKTVTRTFAIDFPIAIPGTGGATVGPAGPYPTTLLVQGFKRARIKDVNVTLHGFGHHNPDDADVLLIGPKGQRALVMSDVGGTDDTSNLTLTFDDEAAAPLPDSAEPISGSFRPTNAIGNDPGDPFPPAAPILTETTALSVFDGSKPNGLWLLFIRDDLSGGTGIVADGWSLEITAKVKKKKTT